jgi:hypothetical protein
VEWSGSRKNVLGNARDTGRRCVWTSLVPFVYIVLAFVLNSSLSYCHSTVSASHSIYNLEHWASTRTKPPRLQPFQSKGPNVDRRAQYHQSCPPHYKRFMITRYGSILLDGFSLQR